MNVPRDKGIAKIIIVMSIIAIAILTISFIAEAHGPPCPGPGPCLGHETHTPTATNTLTSTPTSTSTSTSTATPTSTITLTPTPACDVDFGAWENFSAQETYAFGVYITNGSVSDLELEEVTLYWDAYEDEVAYVHNVKYGNCGTEWCIMDAGDDFSSPTTVDFSQHPYAPLPVSIGETENLIAWIFNLGTDLGDISSDDVGMEIHFNNSLCDLYRNVPPAPTATPIPTSTATPTSTP